MDNAMDRHLDGDRICDLAEGTLDPALRAEAEAHVRGCADCRRELEAARGYLREMSALTAMDSVKAPPNFLANVRARLPQPSPLKRLLDGFLRPFRVIPMQLALLTVLGLTAISSYLYQRGGLHESPATVAVSQSETAPEPVASLSLPERAPVIAAQKRAASRGQVDGEFPEGKGMGSKQDAPAEEKLIRSAPRPPAKTIPKTTPNTTPNTTSKTIPKTIAKIPVNTATQTIVKNAARNDARAVGTGLEDAAITGSRSRPAPASEPPAPAVEATSVAEEVYISSPGQDHDKKTEEVSKRIAAGGKRREAAHEELESLEAYSGEREAEIAASADLPASAPAGLAEEAPSKPKAKASMPAELPGFSLRLDPGKRSADVLAGLKAMGAELVSGPERGKSGEPPGEGYVLRVPVSMIKDFAPYLARYGKAERSGILPTGESPTRILLRILPAPK
jgi:hypothetical protein